VIARIVALVVLAIGLALLVLMVTTEGEPGALPLLLVVLGGGGYLVARARNRDGVGYAQLTYPVPVFGCENRRMQGTSP
jgi:hypothetical protein